MDYAAHNSLIIRLTDSVTGNVTEYPVMHNEVLDNFFIELRKLNGTYLSCKLGRGSAATTSSMTSLVDRIPIPSPSQAAFNVMDSGVTKYDPTNQFVRSVYSATFTYSAGTIVDPVREIGFTLGLNQQDSNTISSRIRLADFGFSEITPGPTETFSLDYTIRTYVSYKPQSLLINLNKDGTTVPTTIRYYPYKNGAITSTHLGRYVNDTDNVTVYDYKPTDSGSNNGNSFTVAAVAVTKVGNAWQALKVTIPAASANWANGIVSASLSDGSYIEFDPPIFKNADSTFTFALQLKSGLEKGALLTAAQQAVDPSIPIVDLYADRNTMSYIDSVGNATLQGANYKIGVFAGLPGIVTATRISRFLHFKVLRMMTTRHAKWSTRSVVLLPDSLVTRVILSRGVASVTAPLISAMSALQATSSGTLVDDNVRLASLSVEGALSNVYGKWVEIVTQYDNGSYRMYLNGVAINSSEGCVYDGAIYGVYGDLLLCGANVNSESGASAGILLNAFSFYMDHLVNPVGLPNTTTRPTLARTMLLETFSNWPSPTQPNTLLGKNANVTVDLTGGPNGIPCAVFTNGAVDIVNPEINFLPDEEFTLEFDLFSADSTGLKYPVVLDNQGSVDGKIKFYAVHCSSGSTIVSDNGTPGSALGTMSIPTYGVWNNWVLVYRKVANVPTLYVCRNGQVIYTKTYPTDSTAILPIGLGKILLGTLGGNVLTAPTNNFKLANLRLTRGVVEYFNTGGFAPPVGLKTALV